MQLNSCRCQLEFPIEPSLCNVRELHLLIVFQDLFFLTSVAIQCQNLTSCLLKNLQLHIFLPPDPLWSYLKQPYPKAVSYNVDGTIKTFLNVCESLLKILLVHQHVNGCSHCSEVKKKKKKVVLLSSQNLLDYSSLSIQLLLQPFYSQYNCFMAWSETPPQLFIGGIFFQENCSSFN